MRQFADRLLAGIDQVGVDFLLGREGADPQHAVFRLQGNGHPRRNMVGNQGRNADPQIDVVAIAQFLRGASGHLVAAPALGDVIMRGHQPTSVVRVVRNSIFLS